MSWGHSGAPMERPRSKAPRPPAHHHRRPALGAGAHLCHLQILSLGQCLETLSQDQPAEQLGCLPHTTEPGQQCLHCKP